MKLQKGFGVVELMIGILITGIITAGLYSLLTSSVVSYGFTRASNEAVGASRRVNLGINTYLFQAGFINYRAANNNSSWNAHGIALDSLKDSVTNWTNDMIISSNGDDITDIFGDVIVIRFRGASTTDDAVTGSVVAGVSDDIANGYIYDCTGQAVTNTRQVELALYVNENGLQCEQVDVDHSGDDNHALVTLDSSIKFMALEFASIGNEDATEARTFRRYKEVIADNDIANIDAVRFALVTSQATGQRFVQAKGDAELDLFGDASVKYKIDEQDKSNVHRILSGTVSLINKMN